MDDLDPTVRSKATANPASSNASLVNDNQLNPIRPHQQQQQPLPPSSWRPHLQQQQQHSPSQLGPASHTYPIAHNPDQATAAFSPQTPNSTSTAPTPSTAITNIDALYHQQQQQQKPSPAEARPSDEPQYDDPSIQRSSSTPVDNQQEQQQQKKHRACDACRELKVKCTPAEPPNDPEGPCQRCRARKDKKPCITTPSRRKRAKKTDTRVAELERKLNEITATITAVGGAAAARLVDAVVGGEDGEVRGSGDRETGARYPTPQSAPPAGAAASSGAPPPLQPYSPSIGSGMVPCPVALTAGSKRKHPDDEDETGAPSAAKDAAQRSGEPQPPDIVDRGVLNMERANELYTRYTTLMCPHLPGVVFPPEMTAAQLRATKPILFMAVMAAASSEIPNLQRTLTRELMQLFGDKIIVNGNKSLELVQALQVATVWYWPPERFEELKFYQLTHVAAVMAIELGLGRKKAARGGFKRHMSSAWPDHPLKKPPPPDPTTLEARRAWLTCYFMAVNTSMALHRPNLIRWTPFVDECIDVLESSPDAAPTDKYLCQLVWTHRLAEEISVNFSMDDQSLTPNLAEARTQNLLRGFELQLEKRIETIPKGLHQPLLKMSFHVINLYMHEVATHNDSCDDSKTSSCDTVIGVDGPLSAAHINALTACLTAIDGIFEVFLSLDVATIRCLPVFNFVRLAYAVVVLIKLYFAAASPKCELGKIISKESMKVELYLDRLLEKFRATAADARSRPAAKLLVVLFMLRNWFHGQKQKQNGGANAGPSDCSPPYPRRSDTGTATPVPLQQPQRSDYPTTATTPLQVLSELAANNSAAAGASVSRPSGSGDMLPPPPVTSGPLQGPSASSPWLNRQPQPPPQQQLIYDQTSASTPQQNQQQRSPAHGTSTTANFMVGAVNPQHQHLHQPMASPSPSPGPGPNDPLPWQTNFALPNADFDYDYANFGDGFTQAWDLTLGGFMEDPGFGFGMDDQAMRFMMQDMGPAAAGPEVGPGVGPGVGPVGPAGAGWLPPMELPSGGGVDGAGQYPY